MSLKNCIPGLVERGEATPEQAARMTQLFDELQRDYRRQFGDQAADAMASEATLKALRSDALQAKRQKLLTMRAQSGIKAAKARWTGKDGDPAADVAILVPDERAPYDNVELRSQTVEAGAHALMDRVLERFHRGVGNRSRNLTELGDVVREAKGEATGNAAARELAQGWLAAAEYLRGRFNSAGGHIGKLDGWGLPHSHDSDLIRAAGFEAWRAKIIDRLDHAAMRDQLTGLPMTREQLETALPVVFETMASDGWSKLTPGQQVGSSLASRHGDHRFLIFKSADDWLDYQAEFGRGTAFDAMMMHIKSMSRDIAAMEILGPNPEATIRWMGDSLVKDAALKPDAVREAARKARIKLDAIWAEYNGADKEVYSRTLANIGSTLRGVNTSAKLGSALLSAVPGDAYTSFVTLRLNRLPVTKMLGNYLKLLNPADAEHRRLAIRLGLGAQSWAEGNMAAARLTGSDMSAQWAQRLATTVLQVSGLVRHTDSSRQAMGLTVLGHAADVRETGFDGLDEGFRDLLARHGIGPDGWNEIRAAPPMVVRGSQFIDPAKIGSRELADRLLAAAHREANMGTPLAGLETRTEMAKFMGRAGTVQGEVARAMLLFKSFGIQLLMTNARRMLRLGNPRSRASYGFAFVTAGWAAGALIVQSRNIAAGRDPEPMDTWQFHAKALMAGGSFGILGDVFAQSVDQRLPGSTMAERGGSFLGGPVLQTIGATVDLGLESSKEVLGDAEAQRKANPGKKLVKLLQSETPGSNIWYSRLAFQRLFLDHLSEAVDPNYRRSRTAMEKRARDNNQGLWWRPGDVAPERVPDFANAFEPSPEDSP